MTYTIQYVRLCLRILLPKNEKNQKNGNICELEGIICGIFGVDACGMLMQACVY